MMQNKTMDLLTSESICIEQSNNAFSRTISSANSADAQLQARLAKLPAYLRDAARRSWEAREEDYRYLAER